MGWLNGILPQNAICLTGVNNGILNHLRDMGVVPLLVTSDSANPGQPDAFPNLFMAPRQGSRETSVDIHACMPSRCRFHFHRGNSRKEGRPEGGRGNTVRASRAKIASSLDADARACAAYARLQRAKPAK